LKAVLMQSIIEYIDFHGTPSIRLQTRRTSQAIVSLRGAQVLSWIPAGGRERLYLSPDAVFDGSRSIRGGIPVCFPQFSSLGDLPKHGILRTLDWTVTGQKCASDYVWVTLEISDTAETRALWPHPFRAELTVGIEADHLGIELEIENTGQQAFSFTGALHSYLRVSEAEALSLTGLYGLEYRDAAKGNVMVWERSPELLVEDEVDRVYHNLKRPLLLDDGSHRLGIEQEGFPDVVVWNPWETLCRELPDMPDADFRRMLCVEAAVAQLPITLNAGDVWWGRQSLTNDPEITTSKQDDELSEDEA
jgi:glucose-6-phosphate 1-epimerase